MIDALVAAFSVGLLGAGHCFGMCGGINAALAFAIPESRSAQKIGLLFAYNLGRIASYGLIGCAAGALGYSLQQHFSGVSSLPILRSIAAVLLVLMGLYLADWWRALRWLEKGGGVLWRHIQPLAQRVMPVNTYPKALLLGALWGWLPCGLVYTALAYALAQASPVRAGAVMLAFGLGTLPAVLLGGVAGQRLKTFLQRRALRVASGILLILFGLWTLISAYRHNGHSHHHHHPQAAIIFPAELAQYAVVNPGQAFARARCGG